MEWWLLFACIPVAFFFSAPGCCCAVSGCLSCLNGTDPPDLTVVITGMTGCTFMNATWVVPLSIACHIGGTLHETQYQLAAHDDGDRTWIIIILVQWDTSGSIRRVVVGISATTNNGNPFWNDAGLRFELEEAAASDPYDCDSFASLDIPFDTNIGPICDGSAATCEVTT